MSEWRDISTAPKDGSRFLAWHPDGFPDFFHWQDMGPNAPVGWRDNFIQVFREGEGPRFWMPLPAPPAPLPTEGRD